MSVITSQGTAPTPTHTQADLLGKWLKELRIPELDWGCSDSPILQMGKQRPRQFLTHFLKSPPFISGHRLAAGVMAVDQTYPLTWSIVWWKLRENSHFSPYVGPTCCYKPRIRISNLSEGFF